MLGWVQGLGWAAACAKPAFLQQCKESELGACSAAQVLRKDGEVPVVAGGLLGM